MAKREVIGLVVCPECDASGAEIKAQKNGRPYRYCPECNAQYFARDDRQEKNLLEKIGTAQRPLDKPAGVTKEVPPRDPVAAPVVPVLEVKSKKASSFDDAVSLLGG